MNVIVPLAEVDRHRTALAGGKAANLGELAGIPGVAVPPGFCVTTRAFATHVESAPDIAAAVDRLESRPPGQAGPDAGLCADIRSRIERLPVPDALVRAIADCLAAGGDEAAWAVRSSATAEDMPAASFAGQHESYLDLHGVDAVVAAIRRCWASLFTERAVAYRQRHGIAHRGTALAVIVQRMVPASASGVMFTADPVTGDRTVVAIEACAGTGEALAAGVVVPDSIKLRDGRVIGATGRDRPLLSDRQAHALAELGRRIAAHFGGPQDIEWCLADGGFWIVQSRPITTLFPVPDRDDGQRRVYLSVGHQQMMTDAMKPLGLSFWQMVAARPMFEAGGRLFVDITAQLASSASRTVLLKTLNRDPLIKSAVNTLLERGFIATLPDRDATPSAPAPSSPDVPDPALVGELIRESGNAVAEARRRLADPSGSELVALIAEDLAALKQQLAAPRSRLALMAGIDALWWLDDHLGEWLGERGLADVLTQSVDNNITSRMGLDLLDVADAIRPHPAAVSFLRRLGAGATLAGLERVEGGRDALAAIDGYLEKYGMRCAGEIDLTRPRWRERPAALVPMILANVDRFEPGEARRRFDAGLARARAAERDVLRRLRAGPDGDARTAQTKDAIDRLRAFIGYRESPKYGWMCRFDVYKQALWREAGRLVRGGVLDRPDDIFYLRFDELREVVRAGRADRGRIAARRAEFAAHERLVPPRVLTSDGEGLFGTVDHPGLPAGALAGLAVSAGTVEGRARVVTDIAAADIASGDILVTTYTDPSWTPSFLTVAGLVTEAGGQMSHGAVIAREYGLPAVVAVQDATRRISDGQRIRLDGTRGVVTILTD
ncbi:phosphoenolpyruvate synthase [Massilia sp. Root335]|uniref:phosphoenolpyruvate synthase n=1 Tax=Massilia sp. Root335 TaxID=1736517 RepID=UPI000701793F|nr:phosphoenolpyruvate synthase [Massilia sp. Root335]KQV51923.1 phosphoenolpyruvate synthase [Massilia sp. Root335]